MSAPFFICVAFIVANNKLNELLSTVPRIDDDEEEVEEGEEDEVEEEEEEDGGGHDGEEVESSFRRIDSDYSLGMSRNKSVDDLIQSFDLCQAGKTAILLCRFASYSMLAFYAVGGLATLTSTSSASP